MATEEERGSIVGGIKVDVVRLHETWMELLFPRQRRAEHSVLGKWKPTGRGDRIKYRIWAALGVPVIALLYPMLLAGLATRFYSRRFDSVATRIGLAGVVVALAVLWAALTLLARIRFDPAGFLAVAAASLVAVVSAALAYVFTRRGGRATTVLLAYPFAMTAVFLPPVVAALYSPTLAAAIFPRSESLAAVVLNTLNQYPGQLGQRIRRAGDLEGVGYVLMWWAIAVPLGWLLGLFVTIADLARPKGDDEDDDGGSGDGD